MGMEEKLREDFERCVKNGIGGHCIGFYAELNEPVGQIYLFRGGVYKLQSVREDRFYWWAFEPNSTERLD